jgi:YVTN family beta-propeller protein
MKIALWQLGPAAMLMVLFSSACTLAVHGSEPDAALSGAKRLRRPVALVCVDGGKTLLVANQRSGSISVIDTASRLIAEHDVGRGLSAIVLVPGGPNLLAVDQAANELLLLLFQNRSLQVVDRLKVPADPIKVAVSRDGSSCVVGSLWSRRLTFVALADQTAAAGRLALSCAGSLDLPFCPRELSAIGAGTKIVVADAFGGRLAVVDTKGRMIESVRNLPVHNIRGLAFAPDGQTLLIAHQVLSRLAHADFDDVHWGLLVRNHLRTLRTDALVRRGPDATLLDGSRLYDLGDVGYAAGDPSGLAFDIRGNLAVTLAGVDEVAITANAGQAPRRTVVGGRPSAVAPSPDGSVFYVANTLDDTVSVVATASGQQLATISLGPRPELSAAGRGERHFYSAKLSHDGWMSCHSCHTDGHTNNLVSDTLGDGSFGAPKRVPSLLGVGLTGPWTWIGSIDRLEDQVRKSITTTMRGPKPSDDQVADLTAYLRSLSPPALAGSDVAAQDSALAQRGQEVFHARKCSACHAPPEYTSPERYDVGLVDEVGNRKFNPPSLRGLSQRDTLLHDGRARSLADVFQKERHPGGLSLTSGELAELVAFLKTL